MTLQDDARELLKAWRGDTYVHGLGILPTLGRRARELGRRAGPGATPALRSVDPMVALSTPLSEAGWQIAG